MTFLNPLVLLGLVASSVPLLLHLFSIRKSKPIEFSSLRFLKELQKTSIKKLKVKRLLLLLLRTLLITFIVLAFARPTIQSSLPVLGTHAKTSAVIIIDNSASMSISDGKGNRLSRVKNISTSIIEALREGDEIAIVSANTVIDNIPAPLTTNVALIRQEIDKIQTIPNRFPLRSALSYASSLLKQSNNIAKEVYVLTDGQHNIINDNSDSSRYFEPGTGIFIVPIGDASEKIGANISIDSVRVITSFVHKDTPVEVEAFIRNDSEKDIDGIVVSCHFNTRRVAQKSIDLAKKEMRAITLSAIPNNDGVIQGMIEVENDILLSDNKRYFSINVPSPPIVGIIGTPQTASFADIALMTGETATRSLQRVPQLYQPLQSPTIDWDNIQALIVSEYINDKSIESRLRQFIEEGGGVLYFCDTKSTQSLVSTQLQSLGFDAVNDVIAQKNQSLQLSLFDYKHPLFNGIVKMTKDKSFVTLGDQMIQKARVINGGTPILSIAEGAIIAEKKVGKGKILYCGLPPTTEWSTLIQLPIFPAFMVRSVQYLSQSETRGKAYIVDDNVLLPLPKKFSTGGTFTIADGQGISQNYSSLQYPSGAVISFGVAKIPGAYSVMANTVPAMGFSINPPSHEGHLRFLSKEVLEKTFQNYANTQATVATIEESSNIAKNVAMARTGSELWKACLACAMLCAIAEMIVARTTKNDMAGENM